MAQTVPLTAWVVADAVAVVEEGTGGEEAERWVTICHATGAGSCPEMTSSVNAGTR